MYLASLFAKPNLRVLSYLGSLLEFNKYSGTTDHTITVKVIVVPETCVCLGFCLAPQSLWIAVSE